MLENVYIFLLPSKFFLCHSCEVTFHFIFHTTYYFRLQNRSMVIWTKNNVFVSSRN